MSEPQGPGMEPLDPEYAAALDRFLDGITVDGNVDAEVRADTDAIARALGLIGGALASEGAAAGVTAGAGAVAPATAGGAQVVQLSSWRSKLNPRVLAAAASLLVVLGVGIPLTMNSTGGTSDGDATTAFSAPEPAADSAENVPMAAPEAPAAEAYGDETAADTAAGSLTTTDGGKAAAAVPGAATGANSGTASAGGTAAAPATKAGADDAARQAGTPQFADAVACARAIVIGTITGVQPAPDGRHYNVTILVSEWIAPASGPVSVTHQVLGSTANSPGDDEDVQVGMRRLFVIAASPEERIYAFKQADWADTRKRIAAIREERAGAGC